MFMGKGLVTMALGLTLIGTPLSPAQDTEPPQNAGLGTPLELSEIERLSITIFPDGRNLPEGNGTIPAGKALYSEKCAACHGRKGKEGPASRLVGSEGFFSIWDPLRILRISDNSPMHVNSTGAQWPYATTLFDYVRRAMPSDAPKSLTNNEVYALTAYVLFLNNLVEGNFVADKTSLVNVEMPGLARSVSAWGDDE